MILHFFRNSKSNSEKHFKIILLKHYTEKTVNMYILLTLTAKCAFAFSCFRKKKLIVICHKQSNKYVLLKNNIA